MKKLICFLGLLTTQVAFGQQEMRVNLEKIMSEFSQFVSVTPTEINSSDGIYIFKREGADALITERNNLYTWRLLTEYYYDYEIDSTGTTTGMNLDYRPNQDTGRLFPAFFALWLSRPYDTLIEYRDVFIAASKAVAGSSYLELTNEPDTLYNDIPGWDYSYQYRSGGTVFALKSHIVYFDQTAFNVFFLTTKSDFDSSISQLWYSIILAALNFDAGTTAVTEREHFENLRSFMLLQNYPNPFNALTSIPFSVDKRSRIKLDIIDINGKLVERILDKVHEPGSYQVKWEAKLSSGIYFYRISNGVHSLSQRMILLK